MNEQARNKNKEFYSDKMVASTIYRENIFPAEDVVLRKYLRDTNKSVVEAGAGGGRLTFFIESMGFNDVVGFDIVPEMIDYAQEKARKNGSKVRFVVGDASDLGEFANETFDYLVYAQQVLCFVPDILFNKSLEEAYRIAKGDSTTIFTFLDYDSKRYNPLLGGVANLLRKFRGETTSKYHLPWLKINNTQFNWKLFHRDQPTVLWVKKEHILAQLEATGFQIIEAARGSEIAPNGSKGVLYVVCGKG